MGQVESGMYLVETPAEVAALRVKDEQRLAFVTQTTLSMDDAAAVIRALRARFPTIVGPKKDDICYATQNRQDAVKVLAAQCDVVIVVGSRNSSNSNRLREVAENFGLPAYMVDNGDDLDPSWVLGKKRVGVTAGASAPEILVQGVVDRLRELGATEVSEMDGIAETVVFPLPKKLATVVEAGLQKRTPPCGGVRKQSSGFRDRYGVISRQPMRLPEPALPPRFTPNTFFSPVAVVVMSFNPPPGRPTITNPTVSAPEIFCATTCDGAVDTYVPVS
jgi:hypothetical protein